MRLQKLHKCLLAKHLTSLTFSGHVRIIEMRKCCVTAWDITEIGQKTINYVFPKVKLLKTSQNTMLIELF